MYDPHHRSLRADRLVQVAIRLSLTVAFVASFTTFAVDADAQSCEAQPGTVQETFPASGSRSVPRNGLILIVYCHVDQPVIDREAARLLLEVDEAGPDCACPAGTECLDVGRDQRCLQEVETFVAALGDEVRLITFEPLEPTSAYVIEAPEPSEPVRIRFTTGTVIDESPPEFDGLLSLEIDGCGPGFAENVACPAELDEDGFVVVLQTAAARDEAGAVNVEYRAFQIRGDQRIERGRARGDGVSDVALSLFVPGSELTDAEWEQMCFTLTARDPYGHETSSDQVLCELTPEYSPFGNACSMASSQGATGHLWLVWALLGLVVVLRASSAQSRRRSAARSSGSR